MRLEESLLRPAVTLVLLLSGCGGAWGQRCRKPSQGGSGYRKGQYFDRV